MAILAAANNAMFVGHLNQQGRLLPNAFHKSCLNEDMNPTVSDWLLHVITHGRGELLLMLPVTGLSGPDIQAPQSRWNIAPCSIQVEHYLTLHGMCVTRYKHSMNEYPFAFCILLDCIVYEHMFPLYRCDP